jgi:hypothetical protein
VPLLLLGRVAAAAVLQFRLNYCFVSRPVKIAVVGPKSVSSLCNRYSWMTTASANKAFCEHAACWVLCCCPVASLSLGGSLAGTQTREKSRVRAALELSRAERVASLASPHGPLTENCCLDIWKCVRRPRKTFVFICCGRRRQHARHSCHARCIMCQLLYSSSCAGLERAVAHTDMRRLIMSH